VAEGGLVIMSVTRYVCLQYDNFRKPWRRKFIFRLRVRPRGIRLMFVHEGHRLKVKVTGAKKRETPYSLSVTTLIGSNAGSV